MSLTVEETKARNKELIEEVLTAYPEDRQETSQTPERA